jgi:ribonuclease J
LDPAEAADSRPRGTPPQLEQARLGLDNGIPSALVQENGDLIRLAPGDPKKIGEERVGRLVLDGDVILPADGRPSTSGAGSRIRG